MKTTASLAFAVAILALSATGAPASASLFCEINKSPDGFAALRAGPDPKARLVARMRVGDEALIDGGVERRGKWEYVTWWKGGRFKKKHPEGGFQPKKPKKPAATPQPAKPQNQVQNGDKQVANAKP